MGSVEGDILISPITANYLSYGFKGVLPKPYTMKQLEEAIQKAMAEL